MDKKTRRNLIIVFSGLICVAAIVAFVALIVFWPSESYVTKTSSEDTSVASLVCRASNPTEAFFRNDKAESPLYVVKASYSGGELTGVSFNYSAKFASKDEASHASSEMVADYNIYMAKQSVEASTYYPNFRNIDEEVRIDLYSSSKDFTLAFSKVVLSGNTTTGSFAKKSHSELKRTFETFGYRCEYSE